MRDLLRGHSTNYQHHDFAFSRCQLVKMCLNFLDGFIPGALSVAEIYRFGNTVDQCCLINRLLDESNGA